MSWVEVRLSWAKAKTLIKYLHAGGQHWKVKCHVRSLNLAYASKHRLSLSLRFKHLCYLAMKYSICNRILYLGDPFIPSYAYPLLSWVLNTACHILRTETQTNNAHISRLNSSNCKSDKLAKFLLGKWPHERVFLVFPLIIKLWVLNIRESIWLLGQTAPLIDLKITFVTLLLLILLSDRRKEKVIFCMQHIISYIRSFGVTAVWLIIIIKRQTPSQILCICIFKC